VGVGTFLSTVTWDRRLRAMNANLYSVALELTFFLFGWHVSVCVHYAVRAVRKASALIRLLSALGGGLVATAKPSRASSC
jgi:hypothetical protein